MAKVFLDTNIFIDFFLPRNDFKIFSLEEKKLFISNLSIHILCYVNKIKIPSKKLIRTISVMTITSFNKEILSLSLQGPTSDFEDNIQLHSAAAEECDLFITRDKKLLALKFFGKTKIIPHLEES